MSSFCARRLKLHYCAKKCYNTKGGKTLSLESAIVIAAVHGDKLSPKLSKSLNYKHWLTIEDWRRCMECATKHGKIFSISEIVVPDPPIHPNCRCWIQRMEKIKAGTATINGYNGADKVLKLKKVLPDYYISKEKAIDKGWRPGKWPSNFVKGKTITGGVYKNRNGHLPQKSGRIWYEADINYKAGKRNTQRILWSNDGLMFVTCDHYKTFYEII